MLISMIAKRVSSNYDEACGVMDAIDASDGPAPRFPDGSDFRASTHGPVFFRVEDLDEDSLAG